MSAKMDPDMQKMPQLQAGAVVVAPTLMLACLAGSLLAIDALSDPQIEIWTITHDLRSSKQDHLQ